MFLASRQQKEIATRRPSFFNGIKDEGEMLPLLPLSWMAWDFFLGTVVAIWKCLWLIYIGNLLLLSLFLVDLIRNICLSFPYQFC